MVKKINKYVFETSSVKHIPVSPAIEIFEINNFKNFKNFFHIPWTIYKDDSLWVPPFWKEYKEFFATNNPFWTHAEVQLFIVTVNQIPVGRIAAIVDHLFIEKETEKIGYFGFFDCINDFKVATALFDVAQQWLVSKGMTIMRGPINGRIDMGCGFLCEGFESSPFILGMYSPHYYIDLAEQYGMKKCRDLVSYYLDLSKPIPAPVKAAADRCKENGIRIRGFNRLQTKKEMNWWIPLMMQEFSNHWGYVPVSEKEVRTRFGVKQARWFVDSGLFLIAEINGEPISFKWSTPDYNQVLTI